MINIHRVKNGRPLVKIKMLERIKKKILEIALETHKYCCYTFMQLNGCVLIGLYLRFQSFFFFILSVCK